MTKNKKILSTVSFTFALLVVLPLGFVQPVQAATSNLLSNQQIENRCNLITQRVDLIINKYNTTKKLHLERYQNIKTRVEKLTTNLGAKGFDVSKLQTDLQQLNSLILTFSNQYQSFIGQLTESKSLVCGNGSGDYKAKVQESRATLLTARETSLDIRALINNTIRPDIQALREQVKK